MSVDIDSSIGELYAAGHSSMLVRAMHRLITNASEAVQPWLRY